MQAFLAPVELPVEAAESVDTAITPLDIEAPDGAGEPPLVLDGPPEVDDSLLSGPPLDVEPPPESIGEDDAPKAAKELIVFLEPDDGTEPIRFLDGPPRIAEELPIEFIPDDPGLEPQTMVPDYAPKFLLPFPVDGDWIMPAEIDWMAELAFADDEPLTADVWLAGAAADPIAQAGEAPIALPLEITAAGSLTDILADCDIMPIPENQGPDAQDDSIETTQGTAVDGTVAINDSDADGDDLTFYVEDGPVSGSGSIDFYDDGTYTYTPNAEFSGTDTFTYEISDQQCGTDTACVTIDVAPQPNECPEAVNDDFATCEDETLTGNVLINDGDVDGDTLTASPLTDVLTSEGGLVTLHQDGSFIYMPASGFSGVDTLTYSMSDGNGGTATETVSITVHDIADPQDDLFSGDEGTSIAGDVILNDGTVTAGSSVVVVDGPANGTLTLNTDGTFNYLPNDGFCGEDSFSYAINGPCQPSETANVRLVVSEIVWYTTIVSAGNNGQVWGDPHFEGDDGGLYDVQGEAGHIYNLLSDYGLQVNALFVPWEGHAGSTMVGAIGVRIGNDLIQANLSGTDVNGVELQAGGSRVIGATTVEFDGEYTTVTTAEYKLEFRRREGWMNIKLDAIDPFADNIAPHGLWGLTVDGDADPRNGDYFKDNWNYALQGGGALDTVDEDGNLVVSQRGDDSAYNLYSTEALNIAGDPFFRFDAAEGTGLERV